VSLSWAALLSFHPRSAPQAVAHEAGTGGVVVGSSLAGSTRDPAVAGRAGWVPCVSEVAHRGGFAGVDFCSWF
jgi:hypothetical protein